ncbi:unnamed protein product [Protopolystoma xenopodis]|uniref:Uncharacterized protein n=1 Tax=Protopolystoma xenopodis TaxID=117903 RepID=A0A3S5CIP2_9PLAT|nr:unnamed protein product [Protopolystoma xenopodis]
MIPRNNGDSFEPRRDAGILNPRLESNAGLQQLASEQSKGQIYRLPGFHNIQRQNQQQANLAYHATGQKTHLLASFQTNEETFNPAFYTASDASALVVHSPSTTTHGVFAYHGSVDEPFSSSFSSCPAMNQRSCVNTGQPTGTLLPLLVTSTASSPPDSSEQFLRILPSTGLQQSNHLHPSNIHSSHFPHQQLPSASSSQASILVGSMPNKPNAIVAMLSGYGSDVERPGEERGECDRLTNLFSASSYQGEMPMIFPVGATSSATALMATYPGIECVGGGAGSCGGLQFCPAGMTVLAEDQKTFSGYETGSDEATATGIGPPREDHRQGMPHSLMLPGQVTMAMTPGRPDRQARPNSLYSP